jgi:hypothetical protein
MSFARNAIATADNAFATVMRDTYGEFADVTIGDVENVMTQIADYMPHAFTHPCDACDAFDAYVSLIDECECHTFVELLEMARDI